MSDFFLMGFLCSTYISKIFDQFLKKGDKSEYSNYRPVSCLPAAAKLLEKIVCVQFEDFMATNGLFPETQHGFRAKRSTQTAWSQIQQQWANSPFYT